MKPQDPTRPVPKKLTLKRETLRRLTPSQLRLAAGGVRKTLNTYSRNITSCACM